MGDVLTYRIPEEKIVQLNGEFKEVQQFDGLEGFIVSTFKKDKKYYFQENITSSIFSYSNETPICYSESEYNELATDFLGKLREQNLSKAIFSRITPINLDTELPPIFNQLCLTYPNAFVYLISSPLFGTWVGATPETLIESDAKHSKTMALAGTLKSESNEKWLTKEQEEQDFVTDYIKTTLNEMSVENLQISNASEVNAGPVRHLKTSFQFQLGGNSPVKIAEKLHPSPAVSGFPQKEALQLIDEVEKHNRKIYAGIIGLIDRKSTHLYVNLRCAEIIQKKAYLYLGGGFTKDSMISVEWQETENKAKTLLNVMKKQ